MSKIKSSVEGSPSDEESTVSLSEMVPICVQKSQSHRYGRFHTQMTVVQGEVIGLLQIQRNTVTGQCRLLLEVPLLWRYVP